MIRVTKITIECDHEFQNMEELEQLRTDIRDKLNIEGSLTVFRYTEPPKKE
ncbi:hypothetical protein [Sunxiuqinia indica]|uniref:hypothetical protein n=1 Tax=Sunxiuqinia indica TaxID=2692584 RepID=UPI001358C39A|nr:hypothetical protein [Sunxiuqinia indica]